VRCVARIGEVSNFMQSLVEKPEWKKIRTRRKRGWCDNIKMCLKNRM
jgi:hypothetical protein